MPNNRQLIENQPSDLDINEFLTRHNLNECENCWISDGFRLINVDSSRKASFSTLDELENVWRDKSSHFFFDTYVNLKFSLPENVAKYWDELCDAFIRLKSKSTHLVLGEQQVDITEAKKSGGANIVLDRKKLEITRSMPKGIRSSTKPLSFESERFHLSIFPPFAVVKIGHNFRSIVPLMSVSMLLDQSTMIGTAPSDAKVIGLVPKNINVSGKRKGKADNRFNQNEMLDKYVLDSILMKIRTAPVEFQFSNTGRANDFMMAYSKYLLTQKELQSPVKLNDSGSTSSMDKLRSLSHNIATKYSISDNDCYDEKVEYWYDDAVVFVMEHKNISATQVRNKLDVDTDIAEKLLRKMEDAGLISELQSNGTRVVLCN